MILISLFGLFLVALIYIILIPYTYVVRKIPGPRQTSTCMGNFWEIRASQAGDCQTAWANQFNESGILRYYFWFNRPSVLLYGPNEIKHVLVTNVSNYESKPSGGKYFDKLFKEGLLFLEGDIHRSHRKMIQPAFNYASLKNMLPIFARKAKEWCNHQQQKLTKDPSNNLVVLDLEMSNLALDVIGLCGFGVEFDAISDQKGEMTTMYKTFVKELKLSFKMLIPFWYDIPFKQNREYVANVHKLEQSTFNIIKNKRQTKSSRSEKSYDLMDLLLDATDDETNAQMTDEQLKSHVMTFMAAGHETTSLALSWMFYCLSQHPDIEAKLYEEIKNVDFTNITIEQLEQLSYLNNVARETLRLYSPAAVTSRVAKEDDTISGYKIPAGTRVMVMPIVQHRLEKYWGPSAMQFDPSRWDTEAVKNLPQCAFMPFLLGPRQCIGKDFQYRSDIAGLRFAMLELRIMAGIILQRYKFKLAEGTKVERKLFLTMKPFPNLPMRVYQR